MPDIQTPAASAVGDRGLAAVRNRTFDEITVGDSASMERVLSLQDIQLFAVLSGDAMESPPTSTVSPPHAPVRPPSTDGGAAKAARVVPAGVIRTEAPSMLTAVWLSALVETHLPGPGTVCVSQSLDFLAPVYAGDRVRTSVTVTARDAESKRLTLACVCDRQDGTRVLAGEVQVIAPTERIERQRTRLP